MQAETVAPARRVPSPLDKGMVFSGPEQGVLIVVEATRVGQWVSHALSELTELSAALGLSQKEENE